MHVLHAPPDAYMGLSCCIAVACTARPGIEATWEQGTPKALGHHPSSEPALPWLCSVLPATITLSILRRCRFARGFTLILTPGNQLVCGGIPASLQVASQQSFAGNYGVLTQTPTGTCPPSPPPPPVPSPPPAVITPSSKSSLGGGAIAGGSFRAGVVGCAASGSAWLAW